MSRPGLRAPPPTPSPGQQHQWRGRTCPFILAHTGLQPCCWLLIALPPCRMREASSRPKREYKPKPREPFDLGEPEQSNGGFPCATAPKITRKERGGGRPQPTSVQTSEPGPPHSLWGSDLAQGSQSPSLLCLQAASSSFRSSDKPIRTPSRSMRECPWAQTLPSQAPHLSVKHCLLVCSEGPFSSPCLVEEDAPGVSPLGPSRAGEGLAPAACEAQHGLSGPPHLQEGLP